MNDDEITRRLADTLHAKAAAVESTPDASTPFASPRVVVLPAGSHRRRPLLVGSALAGIAAVAVVAVVLRSPSRHPSTQITSTATSSVVPSPGPAAPVTTSGPLAPAGPAGPAGGPLPKGFAPVSVTFVSPSIGWALGSAPCSAPPCTSLARTADGGRTWVGVPAPRTTLQEPRGSGTAGISSVRFANRLDGWAFGTELWATHDGGATWHRSTIPGVAPVGVLEDLEAGNGFVHAAVIDAQFHVRVATSPVGSDAWSLSAAMVPVGAGPVPSGQLVLHGGAGWFVQVDRTTIGGLRLVGGQWVVWTPPCATAGGPTVLAASSGTELVAACDVGLWTGGSGAERLFVSHDAGTSFADMASIPGTGAFALAATPGRILAAGEGPGGQTLLLSTDGGQVWVPVLRRSGTSWVDVGFTTTTQGVAVATHELLVTRDGGRTWTSVAFVSAR